MNNNDDLEYAGFWIRTWAYFIDGLLYLLVFIPIFVGVYWADIVESPTTFRPGPIYYVLSYFIPAFIWVMFWRYQSATPGKMAVSLKIVDAVTGDAPSVSQCIGRYLGYLVSGIPLLLGFLWVGLDRRKQSWHDKLAGTVVVRKKRRGPETVKFNDHV